MKNHRFMLSRHIPALLLAAAMITGTAVTPALAASSGHPFQDVPADAPYAAAVQYVYDAGITSGTGAHTYSPDAKITFGEFALMLCRMYWPDEEWTIDSATDYVSVEQLCNLMDPAGARDTGVARPVAYRALLACSGAPIYSQGLYGANTEEEKEMDDAVFTAMQLGLCDEGGMTWTLITRGEAAQILYAASQSDIKVPDPPIVDELNVEIEDDYRTKCAKFLEIAADLPEALLARFNEEGWSLVIGDEYIIQWDYENDANAVGLTSYANETIYTRNASNVPHEFGHFLHEQLGRPQKVVELYKKEAQQAQPVIGDYAMTNESEYFAEIFEKFMLWDDEKLQKLQAAAPETYAYFAQLEAEGWLSAES